MNNYIAILGTFKGIGAYEYTYKGKAFYSAFCEVRRASENVDIVPILYHEGQIDTTKDFDGLDVRIVGSIRTRNIHDADGTHLQMYVLASSVEIASDPHENLVDLVGYICRKPTFKTTPKGTDICCINLAVANPSGRNNYIPCIVWDNMAKVVAEWSVGTCVNLIGRFQSRNYTKDGMPRTTFEISAIRAEKRKGENPSQKD